MLSSHLCLGLPKSLFPAGSGRTKNIENTLINKFVYIELCIDIWRKNMVLFLNIIFGVR